MHRLPYPRKSLLAFPLVLLAAIAFVLAVLVVVSSLANAAPAPAGGPRLGGGAAADSTLIGAFVFDTAGEVLWIDEVDTLRVSSIWFAAYGPNNKNEDQQIEINFTWERSETIVIQEVINGTTVTRTEQVWNTTDARAFLVSAPKRGIDYTEIELPKKTGERLTITYEGGGRVMRIAQVEHHTSPLYEKLPRQVRQDDYVEELQVLIAAFVAAVVGVVLSRVVYEKAGRHVPRLTPRFWALTLVGMGAVAFWFWYENREGLVLRGSLPPLAAFSLLVGFVTLQVWREEPDADLFLSIHDKIETNQPEFSAYRRYIPQGDDPRPLSTERNHIRYVEDTWRAWAWRVFFGARTYLELPPTNKWHYARDAGPFRRLYILDGSGELETVQRPHFDWFPNMHATTGLGRLKPILRIERMGITKVPVSPWAQHNAVVRVLANLKAQSTVAKEQQDLLVRNAELEAALRSGVVSRARKMMDQLLLALRAVRTGKEFEVTLDEHEDLTRTTDPNVQAGHAQHGGNATTTLTPQQGTNGHGAPQPAAAAPGGAP